jgi:hypothetical protein
MYISMSAIDHGPILSFYFSSFSGVTANVGRTNLPSSQPKTWGDQRHEVVPVTVVDLRLCAQKFLLSCLVGQVSPHLVAIFLGL